MKHILNSLATVFVVLVTFASCQSNADLEFELLSSKGKETTNVITRSARNGFESYWDSLEPINWAELNSLEDRFKYFNLPEYEVKAMSSETLLQLIVKYPLNYLITAYDKPDYAIKLVYDNCNIHKEFVKRNQVGLLVNFFMSHDCSVKNDYKNSEYNFIDELFIEYLLASELIDITIESEVLKSAVLKKIELYTADSTMNSALTLTPLSRIEKKIRTTRPLLSSSSSDQTTHIYTPTFQELNGTIYTEMTQDQKISLNVHYSNLFPSAVILGSSSAKYNCHSYAWYDNSQTNTIWLKPTSNGEEDGPFQLSKYWTPGISCAAYEPCSAAVAEKVYYDNGPNYDHSAIMVTPTIVVSKWGAGPLMQHSIQNCPYFANNLQYYKFKPRESPILAASAISGNSTFPIETTQEFRVSKKVPGMTHVWSVEPINGQGSFSYEITTNSSGNLLIKCHEYGAYKIRADFFYKGNNISFCYITAAAIGLPQY